MGQAVDAFGKKAFSTSCGTAGHTGGASGRLYWENRVKGLSELIELSITHCPRAAVSVDESPQVIPIIEGIHACFFSR
jgi:hypothetical protein